MSTTPSRPPRSRAASRTRTSPGLKSAPTQLLIPTLRPTNSLSNLHIHSYNGSPSADTTNITVPPLPSQILDSSASSVLESELNDGPGILVQEVEVEVDTTDGEEGNAVGQMERFGRDEESKKSLRDQLRKTLSRRPSTRTIAGDATHPPHGRSRSKHPIDLHELNVQSIRRYSPREYFILTDAGKPVFASHPEGEGSRDFASTFGIMQALISVFLDEDDKLRCINAGDTRITFLIRSPLYYVCVSSWGEPESVTRAHLEYLHLQILSVVSASQLKRIFERRGNFDLKRLLNGAETFLTSLLTRLEFDLAVNTSSLHCLRIDAVIRKRAADALVPTKSKDILYVVLIARGQVVTLMRPRKHSIHPADIHILLNTVHAPSIINSPASASFIPICLPKFNPAGYVNAYISFLRKDDGRDAAAAAGSAPIAEDLVSSLDTLAQRESKFGAHELDSGIALVCISGGGDFESIRNWCDDVTARLEAEGTLDALTTAFRKGHTEYSVSELGIPGLRHFLYKSRSQVQITVPKFEDPYDNDYERRRLITLYQIMHDAVHGKSGQEGTLKLQYIKTEKESVMGWITQPFELYLALSPRLPKSAAVGAANSVARWVKKEEGKLFLRDAPVF